MSVVMPAADQAVLARRAQIVARSAGDRAGRGRDLGRARDAPLRIRRADRLPAAADGGGAAGDHRAGRRACCAIATTTASGWCRAGRAPRSRAARCRWSTACCSAWPSSTASARSTSTTASRWSSPASPISPSAQAVAARGLLLRARSVVADRLHHRRQRRGEFRRRALPEIRHDHQQRARLRDGADDRRGAPPRRQASRRRRLRPARHHHRLGRAARRRHRGDGAHPEEAGDRARGAGRLSESSEDAGECVSPHHRRGHHPGRHGDDGQARDPRGRGVRPRRLSARRRGAADRRARRAARPRSIT